MDYSRLDPLISISGEKVTTTEQWEKYRREEIMVLLENFVYGVRPLEKPDEIFFDVKAVTENYKGYAIVKKEIEIYFEGYTLPFVLFIPMENYRKVPSPCFLHVLNEFHLKAEDPANNPDNDFLPVVNICKRGYACAILSTFDVSPDWKHETELKKGVFAVMEKHEHRNNRSWANISGWAFGASRVMDYLETDNDVYHNKVAIIGHSRAGKTALWAAATDKRFAMSYSNDSGCGGAAFARDNEGERITDINISDWFCDNYKNFNDHEEWMPCDQHLLLSAIAPRPLYVKSNVEDLWACPKNERLSCRLASPVWELYGKKGLIAPEECEVNKPYHEGDIAYHVADGDHNLTSADWELYMDFADKYLK